MDSEFASDGNKSDHFFTSSNRNRLGSVLAVGLLSQPTPENLSQPIAGTFGQRFGCVADRFGGVCMHLKMFVLSASAVALWLAPLSALDKKVSWHKTIQGVSLCAGIACAVKAGSIAYKLSESAKIEVIKERAITADVIDEISTSTYVSQQQRQQEAELMLASSGLDVEAERKSLEAMYENDLQNSASTSDNPDYLVYLEVCKSMSAGKSVTWIVENVLKMGGRKFTEGKVKLESILKQFEGKLNE